MCILNGLNIDHVQLCLARHADPLPPVYGAFLVALVEQERKCTLCLVPCARFDAFHNRLKLNHNPTKPSGERRRAAR